VASGATGMVTTCMRDALRDRAGLDFARMVTGDDR
jgi:hypothetical protein